MKQYVEITFLRANLAEAINKAAYGGEPFIITRRGRRLCAVISMCDLELLNNLRKGER